MVLLAAPTGAVRGRPRLALALLGSVLIAGEVLPQPAVAGYFLVVAGCRLGLCRTPRAQHRVRLWCRHSRRTGAGFRLVGRASWDVGLDRAWPSTRRFWSWWPWGSRPPPGWMPGGAQHSQTGSWAAGRWPDSKDCVRFLRALFTTAISRSSWWTEPEPRVPRGDPAAGSRWTSLPVLDGEEVVAVVTTRSAALADGPTARAVATAVRLTVANLRLNQVQARSGVEVEESRVRLVAAVDRERQRVAARLRDDAGVHLERALAGLAAANGDGAAGMSDLEDLVESEIAAASAEVERIVAGVPPTALGSGRLASAIAALAARSPVPVSLELADDAAADAAIETALFYVCSEALTNIAKHSGATHGEYPAAAAGRERSPWSSATTGTAEPTGKGRACGGFATGWRHSGEA